MSKELRIPPFLSKEFHSLKTKDAREKYLQSYANWRNSEYTEELLRYLEEKLKSKIAEEEREDSFISLFQSKYKSAHNKGSRTTIRELIKAI